VRLVLSFLVLAFLAVPADAGIEGVYDLPGGGSIVVALFDPEPGQHLLSYLEPDTGRFAVLRPGNGAEMVAEATAFPSGGPAVVTLKPSGSGLSLSRAGRKEVLAKRRAVSAVPLVFQAADNSSLHGTLLLPPGRGPHPAIVALHGSGDLTRWAAGPYEWYFVSLGYAVLAFDKRGSGESSDAAKAPDLLSLADDGAAAARALKARSDIRSDRIGIWGPSQGGFLSLVAASRSRDLAFAIDQSGMVAPAWQQNIYQAGAQSRAEGLSAEESEAARGYTRAVMEVARTGRGWDALAPRIAAAATAPWANYVDHPHGLETLQRAWRADFSVDPTSALSQVHVPVLGLFGALDVSTPVMQSVEALRARIKPASNLTIVIVNGADHPLFEAKTGSFSEIGRLSNLSPEALRTLRDFLARMAR